MRTYRELKSSGSVGLRKEAWAIGHIRHNGGTIEPHEATERRLLALEGSFADLFTGRGARLLAPKDSVQAAAAAHSG